MATSIGDLNVRDAGKHLQAALLTSLFLGLTCVTATTATAGDKFIRDIIILLNTGVGAAVVIGLAKSSELATAPLFKSQYSAASHIPAGCIAGAHVVLLKEVLAIDALNRQ